MTDNYTCEVLALLLSQERTANALRQAAIAEMGEGAGARADTQRRRQRRERVARFLKALAFRLAPPVAPETQRPEPIPTAT